MELKYTNTYWDLIGFARYHYVRNWMFWLAVGLFMYSTSRANISAALKSAAEPVVRIVVFVVLESAMLLAFLVFASAIVLLSYVPRRNSTFLTPHTLILDQGGIREQTKYNDTLHTWAAIQKVGRSKRHLFLYVSQHSAHVIPRRAFDSDAAWNELFEMARQYAAASA